jgi:hypothetical protein
MDAQVLRTVGGVAGLAGLAIGMILLLYREIVRKNVFPMLSKRDGYRLLRTITVLSWSLAMFGILCWAWSNTVLHRNQSTITSSISETQLDPAPNPVIAGTVVDMVTNEGIGQATLTIAEQGVSATSDDTGNFRLVLSHSRGERVRLLVTKNGYSKLDRTVAPPTHDLILQMRHQ